MNHVGALLREQAIELASRKLCGQRLKDAKHFLLWNRRSPENIERLMAQLEPLPDLDIDPATRAYVSGISPGEVAAMRTERAAGDTLQVIAARHHVSMSTVSRYTTGVPR